MNERILQKKSLLILLFWGFVGLLSLQAQSQEIDKLVFRGDNYFKIGNYEKALEAYQGAVDKGANAPYVFYMTGRSYLMQTNVKDQMKAIPLLKQAVEANSKDVPKDAALYLGKAYHMDMQLDKAQAVLNKYAKSLDQSDKKAVEAVEKELNEVNNAMFQVNQKKDINMIRLAPPINSEFTEYNPVVSADQSIMAFTSLRPNYRSGQFKEEIYVSYQKEGVWVEPQKLDIKTENNVGTAGISPDGQQMIIYIGGEHNNGNLYIMQKKGNEWGIPDALPNTINSRYNETTASITPDGKTIYFASNRPGGFGGYDIYVSHKDANGNWGEAQNLGPKVNSAADEDAPFIHPDQKSLYFTSNGHSTMGGRDIFKTVLINGQWREPENMGYPINTPLDDNYFTLTADGSQGFFSSNRPGGYGQQDIYTFEMPKQYANIPLTMIKGKITAGDEDKPVPTKIKVIDNENNTKVDYVYNPDPKTGNYLIILPPGKNYDLIIESEGYLPYTLNINIPNQNYFYQLYQKIHLQLIKQFDVVVGQQVQVKNAFYDNGQDQSVQISPRQANEAMLIDKDSVDVYDLMESAIAAEDTAAFNYLLDLMYKTNPIENVDFNSNEDSMEVAQRTYYYDESDTTHLQQRTVDGETIFTLPTMDVTKLAKEQKEAKKKEKKSYDPAILKPVYKIYFDVSKADVDPKYKETLEKVLDYLNKYDDLGIQISGYASAEGDEDYNRKLSNKRAIEVVNFFNYRGIVRRRIIAKGYGSTKADKNNPAENRKVEIQLVDLDEAHH